MILVGTSFTCAPASADAQRRSVELLAGQPLPAQPEHRPLGLFDVGEDITRHGYRRATADAAMAREDPLAVRLQANQHVFPRERLIPQDIKKSLQVGAVMSDRAAQELGNEFRIYHTQDPRSACDACAESRRLTT